MRAPVPGGVTKEITAAHAAASWSRSRRPARSGGPRTSWPPSSWQDLRRLDAQLRDTKKKLAAAVRASGTTVTEVFGVGPVNAGTVIGDVADVARFPSRDHFASCNGTAPVEVSSGNRKIYRLSLRGNRRINHALHMAAITQIRYRPQRRPRLLRRARKPRARRTRKRCAASSGGSATPSTPACRPTPAGPQHAEATGPGGQPGNDSDSSAAGSHPAHRLFGQATPEPGTTLRPATPPRRTTPAEADIEEDPPKSLTAAAKRARSGRKSIAYRERDAGARSGRSAGYSRRWLVPGGAVGCRARHCGG